jgi:tetratricopeptide (TPR) repeat protein
VSYGHSHTDYATPSEVRRPIVFAAGRGERTTTAKPWTRMSAPGAALARTVRIWDEALEQFTQATSVAPGYGEAWREKGIVENKIAQSEKNAMDTDPAPGEASLRRAIELNDKDFDAYAALGGVLKRAKRFAKALAAYEKSYKVSGGHLYPLLNALKLRGAGQRKPQAVEFGKNRACTRRALSRESNTTNPTIRQTMVLCRFGLDQAVRRRPHRFL